MPNNYFTEKRKLDKQALLSFLKSHPELTLKKALGIFSSNTGLAVKTLNIYVRELADAELIDLRDIEG